MPGSLASSRIGISMARGFGRVLPRALADGLIGTVASRILAEHVDQWQDRPGFSQGSEAANEVLTRRQAFQPWLQAGAFDIVQPDVCYVGGIDRARRVAAMAAEASAE